jgi:hypothetical protein
MAYSGAGTTWAIFAYAQLEYFESELQSKAEVYIGGFAETQNLFLVNSNTTMNQLLSGSNCNIPGIYAYKIAPQKCGLRGMRILCPFTLCGIFGRFLGLCKR